MVQITLPNGADGLSPNLDQAWPLTAESADPDLSLPNRAGLTQDYVEGRLKQQRVNDSPGWNRARNAMGAQAQTISGTTAQMMQLLAALGMGSPGADDFERFTSGNLGDAWDVYSTGSGVFQIPNGHDASWDGFGTAEFLARRNDGTAFGNMQTTTILLATTPTAGGIPETDWGYNDQWLRMRGDFTTWGDRTGARLRWGADKTVQLDWVDHGTEHFLGALDLPYQVTGGAVLEFRAGVGSNPYRFVGRLNNEVAFEYIDGDEITQFGEDYRHRGIGGRQEIGFFTAGVPGRFSQWTAQG